MNQDFLDEVKTEWAYELIKNLDLKQRNWQNADRLTLHEVQRQWTRNKGWCFRFQRRAVIIWCRPRILLCWVCWGGFARVGEQSSPCTCPCPCQEPNRFRSSVGYSESHAQSNIGISMTVSKFRQKKILIWCSVMSKCTDQEWVAPVTAKEEIYLFSFL